MKWCRNVPVAGDGRVAPFAGAWIEIVVQQGMERISRVAPFAGAWIEMSFGRKVIQDALVAPFAGAWIEIFYRVYVMHVESCRSLRGSVD